MSAATVSGPQSAPLVRGRTHGWFWSVARSDRRGLGLTIARAGLTALSGVYACALYGYRGLLRAGVLPITRAEAPVISIGNLALGGTGKTSAALAVCRALLAAGARPAVLSRGHGRRSRSGAAVVVSRGAGPVVTWEEAGDEPWLLASKLAGAFVLVGKNRRETAAQAVSLGADVLVLDDGFQYWRLAKDFEIALVDCLDPFGGGRLFPRGTLREPVGHLRRADAVWLTHADLVSDDERAAIESDVRRIHPRAALLRTRHRPLALRAWPGGEEIGVDALRGRRVCALSSIGSPAAFEGMLAAMGAEVIGARFPDHHRFRAQDVKEVAAATRDRAEILVTTEKDRVRLPAASAGTPIWVLSVEICRLDGRPLLHPQGAPVDRAWGKWVAGACGGDKGDDVDA